jgi:hypothetical protein
VGDRLPAILKSEDYECWLPLSGEAASVEQSGSRPDFEQLPLLLNSLQGMFAGVFELDTCARNEVPDSTRNHNLAGVGHIHNARREMNRNPENICFGPLDLAGVQASPNLNAKRDHRFHDRLSTPDRAPRAIERDEKPISQRLNFVAAEARYFPANGSVMSLQQFMPRFVAQFTRPRGRTDDIGEHEGRQHAARFGCAACLGPGDEVHDHIRDLQGIVSDPVNVVRTIQLYELGARNMGGEEPAGLNTDGRILGPVQNKRRNENGRQDIVNVDLAVHAHQIDDGRRTPAQPFISGQVRRDVARVVGAELPNSGLRRGKAWSRKLFGAKLNACPARWPELGPLKQ